MFTTIINDCRDPNAQTRQLTRYAATMNCNPIFVPVTNDLEAGISIVEQIDASLRHKGFIIANVAPRGDDVKRHHDNGTPFCFFRVGGTPPLRIICSIGGYMLSAVQELGITDTVELLDIPTIIDEVIKQKQLNKFAGEFIINSQFRSYDFLPRLAHWLSQDTKIPSETVSLSNLQVPKLPKHVVWCIDCFGNAKLTSTSEDLGFTEGIRLQTNLNHGSDGKVICVRRLADAPNGQLCLVRGSSGFKHHRFCELIIPGGSAAQELGLKIGQEIQFA